MSALHEMHGGDRRADGWWRLSQRKKAPHGRTVGSNGYDRGLEAPTTSKMQGGHHLV